MGSPLCSLTPQVGNHCWRLHETLVFGYFYYLFEHYTVCSLGEFNGVSIIGKIISCILEFSLINSPLWNDGLQKVWECPFNASKKVSKDNNFSKIIDFFPAWRCLINMQTKSDAHAPDCYSHSYLKHDKLLFIQCLFT